MTFNRKEHKEHREQKNVMILNSFAIFVFSAVGWF